MGVDVGVEMEVVACACVYVRASVCVCACVRAGVRVCVCLWEGVSVCVRATVRPAKSWGSDLCRQLALFGSHDCAS